MKRRGKGYKMAKNFGSAGSAQTIKDVAKVSAEKAQVIVLKMIPTECLVDYPKNNEDIEDISDLVFSMEELGFTDPLEVTDFGQPDGIFMIVSGHRRRRAGVSIGMELFPCIVKSFNSEQDIYNYALLSNNQRDSAKDPLLFCKRYKMHEEYLKSSHFVGSLRDEIARRLGVSIPQADRFNTMNKVILPVWELVKNEIVGMSSVLPMASHTQDEQAEIFKIMQEALDKKVTLTRETMKKLVDGYRKGKKTWAEIADFPRDSGLPLNGSLNTEPTETREPVEHDRNGEVQREFDPIGAEADRADAERAAGEAEKGEDAEPKEKKPPLTDEEKQTKRGKDIQKELEKLNILFSDIYTFEGKEEAEEVLRNMASTFVVVVDEMYNVAREHKLEPEFKALLDDMKTKATEY